MTVKAQGALADAEIIRSDAEGDARQDGNIDKLLTGIDSMSKIMGDAMSKIDALAGRMDSVCGRMDAFEKDGEEERKSKADKAKADAEEAEKKKAEGEKAAADKAKSDADEAEKKKAEEEKTKSDAAIATRLAELEARVRPLSEVDRAGLAQAQVKADQAFVEFGERAPAPLDGEALKPYRLRMANKLLAYSPTWKEVDLAVLSDQAFGIAETQIYSDASKAALSAATLPERGMREIKRRLDSGHTITEFRGRSSFVRQFTRSPRQLMGVTGAFPTNSAAS